MQSFCVDISCGSFHINPLRALSVIEGRREMHNLEVSNTGIAALFSANGPCNGSTHEPTHFPLMEKKGLKKLLQLLESLTGHM